MSNKWDQLVSPKRLRPSGVTARGDQGNEFLSDYYRVVFSSAFRRLQDKTQVSPLAATDFVRRRLTHSVEVAVVGERMGRVLGKRLESRYSGNPSDFREYLGKIVATACLLHDIGNPPFGHEGELAIREWADSIGVNSADYRCFDGNAQGFRIAVRLQHHGKAYGLNLTAATLATVLKYPRTPTFTPGTELHKRGKSSVMSSELHHYEEVRGLVGLSAGQRHPLSFVVEAADDIVNRLVDIEDAIKLRLIAYTDVCDVLSDTGSQHAIQLRDSMEGRRKSIDVGTQRKRELWAYQDFRVDAAASLAEACEEIFEREIDAIEGGSFTGDLVDACKHRDIYNALKDLEYERIFGDAAIVRVEAGGKTAIRGLLTLFHDEVARGSKLSETVPQFPKLAGEDCPDESVRRVVDYVAGMTDRFSIKLYQELAGMSL